MNALCNLILLAVLQGISEFLPISSSGHLVICKHLLDVHAPGESLEVVLHVGTMVSIVAYYRKTIWQLLCGFFRWDRAAVLQVLYIALSAIPAVFFYFLCKDKIDAFYENARSVGGFLIFTGVVLTLLRWIPRGQGHLNAGRAVLVGIAQAIAILPGVSRSGMTIAAARMSGVSPDHSAEFSFLMCLPLLAGGALLTLLGHTGGSSGEALSETYPVWMLAVAMAISAIVGYIALSLLVRLLRGGRFWLFGVYCLIVGLLVCFTL
ncbi:MAG: undecaprenyl-diphosphate phosphatase [Kiritimatiellae bacterium]|nr:undecaprenyl-diphosphate phosphatase [Kiritimatiellia bacterium]